MLDQISLGSVEVSAEEAALFKAEVALIPEKKAKKRGSYSKKQENKKFAFVEGATNVLVAPEEPAVVAAPATDLLQGIEDDIFGDTLPEAEAMLSFRAEGFKMLADARAMDIGRLEAEAGAEKRRLSNIVPKKAARMVFDDLGKKTDHQSRLTLAVLEDLKRSFDSREGDPFKKERFIKVVMNAMQRIPELVKEHEENLAVAEKVWAEFLDKQAAHDKLAADGATALDLANEIAEKNGWPKTEARKGGNGKK